VMAERQSVPGIAAVMLKPA